MSSMLQQQEQEESKKENEAVNNATKCYQEKIALLLHSMSDNVPPLVQNNNSTILRNETKKWQQDKQNDPMEWARCLSLRGLYNPNSADSLGTQDDFVCTTCGTLLLLPQNTTIRLRQRKRSRTRRTRSTKYKCQQYQIQSQLSKLRFGSGKEWHSPSFKSKGAVVNEDDAQQPQQKLNYRALHGKHDGMSIHSIVYICHHCEGRLTLKGLPPSSKKHCETKKAKHEVQLTQASQSIFSKQKQNENDISSNNHRDDNYSALQKIAATSPMVPPTTPKQHFSYKNNMPTITHLSQSAGKKKKKKVQKKEVSDRNSVGGGRSKLSTFLSSLND